MNLQAKILGSLSLTAIGDAMGSATENLPFDEIRRKFGGPVTEFLKPGETAFALGNEAGGITDDFSQTYLISKEILKNERNITTDVVISSILRWAEMPQYFNRFAGPTTRSAVAMYKNPNQTMAPLEGAVTVDYASKATNGAAMKVSPAGLFNPGNIENAIKAAITITKVTHDNSLALSGSCAVAASVSASLGMAKKMSDIISIGFYGAKIGEEIGKDNSHYVAGPSVVERMKLGLEIANGSGTKESKLLKISQVVGNGLHISEAVPCEYAIIALNLGNPMQAVIDAVNIGYDTDTIAAIVGSMVGAFAIQDSNFNNKLEVIEKVNKIDIRNLAREIAE